MSSFHSKLQSSSSPFHKRTNSKMERDICTSCRLPTNTTPPSDIRLLGGKPWHAACLCCSVCRIDMKSESMCFFKNGLLMCYPDYARYFGDICPKCGKGFNLDDMVRVIKDNKYHADCFTCDVCFTEMDTGEKFMYKEGQILCRLHYDQANAKSINRTTPLSQNNGDCSPSSAKEVSTPTTNNSLTLQSTPISLESPPKEAATVTRDVSKRILTESHDVDFNYNQQMSYIPEMREFEKRTNGLYWDRDQQLCAPTQDDLVDITGDEVPPQKKKRNRTLITDQQLGILEECYKKSKYVDMEVMQEVSNTTGLTIKSVKIWFQNKRRLAKDVSADGLTTHQLNTLKGYYKQSKYIDSGDVNDVSQVTGLTMDFIRTWFENKRRHEKEVFTEEHAPTVYPPHVSDHDAMFHQYSSQNFLQ